jgi:hypothetical protein
MMMTSRYKYQGAALPGNAEVAILLELGHNNEGPSNNMGHGQYVANIFNSQAGTVTIQVWDDAIAVPAYRTVRTVACAIATTDANRVAHNVSAYRRWKAVWTNGATPQTVFQVEQFCTNDTAPIT